MTNQTSVTEFRLLGFSDIRELQILHFLVFLFVYVAALMGNFLIIVLVTLDHHLHSPMYFFLKNMSFLDLCYISATVPKSMVNAIMQRHSISFHSCFLQLFFFITFGTAELALLTVMAYDRYLAICSPLRYRTVMNNRACVQMAAGSWLSGALYSVLHVGNSFSLPFCGPNFVHQFFCDIPPLLQLSCSDTQPNKVHNIVLALCYGFICFTFIFVSYVHIFKTVVRIPSAGGRYKAFSTCLPHLIVVSLFIGTGFFMYMKPNSRSPSTQDMLVPVLYAVVPPVLNPIIYSLRNKEIKAALRKVKRQGWNMATYFR
ncbi:olfactory receptor 14A16-like [Terrapene carolina triunguis]|uniref:olfactory receptor 14A16-like n=1 Tax=Terrapene triunguis TaxID=2587831 RepID=UPI000E775654|nr:olfactory receptor 14A16-like [Terrapene carolina triunguis]